MPLIGEELRTILGMMPVRDRAGIARGTMADDAMRASAAADSGNAEGAALMQGGPPRPPMPAPPPQIKLPPMGGPNGGGDIQLPDDVATEYASGRKKSRGVVPTIPIMPAPQERVVASGPAAAPGQAVAMRASDVYLAAMEQRARQQKMMQLVGSLGLIANAFNRNPQSQASTKASLADMVGGGGGGGGGGVSGGNPLAEIKTLSEMREKEEKAIADAQAKEAVIQHGMRTQNLTRTDAEALYAAGTLADRTKPDELRKVQDIRDLEVRKRRARELVPLIAKVRGTDPEVLAAMAEKDPDAVVAMGEAEKLTELQGKQTVTAGQQLDNLKKEGKLTAWANAFKDPTAFLAANPDIDPQEFAQWARDPDAFAKGMDKMAERAGQLSETGKSAEKRLNESKITTEKLAQQNAGSNRELQDMWRPDLKTGSPHFSEMMLNFSKSWHKATGQPLPANTRDTELFVLRQVPATLETIGALGTNPSNPDREYAKEAQGGFGTSAQNIQRLLYLKEKENNTKIAAHNRQVEKEAGIHRPLKGKGLEVEYPPPNRFMRAEVEKRKLDKFVEKSVREGTDNDPATRELFENSPEAGVGPGVFDYYVKAERARQGKK